jgi:hypothetical protein
MKKKLIKSTVTVENATADFIGNNVRFDLVTDGHPEGQVRYIPDLWSHFDKEVSGSALIAINDCCIEALNALDEFKDFEIE